MRTVTFVVPDPPPLREHPGRAADRDSPHAKLLASAGLAAVDAEPRDAPFVIAGMTVTFGRTMWDVRPLGYSADGVLLEVLQDVGAVTETGDGGAIRRKIWRQTSTSSRSQVRTRRLARPRAAVLLAFSVFFLQLVSGTF